MRAFWHNIKEASCLWYEKDADSMSATVSYYALFAVTPLLLVSYVLSSWLYGEERVLDTFYGWGRILGSDLINLLHESATNLKDLSADYSAPIIGVLFFSSMVIVLFNTITTGLHDLWSVPHEGLRGWLWKSFFSIVFMCIFEVYLVAMMGFSMLVSDLTLNTWSLFTIALHGFFFIISTTMLFSLAYWWLPWQAHTFGAKIFGAFLASVLLALVRTVVALYLSVTPIPGLYGAAGLMIVLLFWLFSFSAVFYFGAAFAFVYNKNH